MRKIAIAGMVLGATALGQPAAAMSQCYDAQGRPVGPAFHSAYPDHALVQLVLRSGGRCVVIDAGPPPGARFQRDPALAGHAAWCDSIPPSGYCITRDRR